MNLPVAINVKDLGQAGALLAKRLWSYANTGAVVVGIPEDGAMVAASVAAMLGLSFEVMPVRCIRHPADSSRSIGAVTTDGVISDAGTQDIPQDYIAHQVALARYAVEEEWRYYYEGIIPQSFHLRTVILVDAAVEFPDLVVACLRSIGRKTPLKIIFAAATATEETERRVGEIADEVVILQTTDVMHHEGGVKPVSIRENIRSALLKTKKSNYGRTKNPENTNIVR